MTIVDNFLLYGIAIQRSTTFHLWLFSSWVLIFQRNLGFLPLSGIIWTGPRTHCWSQPTQPLLDKWAGCWVCAGFQCYPSWSGHSCAVHKPSGCYNYSSFEEGYLPTTDFVSVKINGKGTKHYILDINIILKKYIWDFPGGHWLRICAPNAGA